MVKSSPPLHNNISLLKPIPFLRKIHIKFRENLVFAAERYQSILSSILTSSQTEESKEEGWLRLYRLENFQDLSPDFLARNQKYIKVKNF